MADESRLRQRIDELEAELATLRTAEGVPYRTVVEDMSELVVRWKPDGTRLFVNDAYCRLFGQPRSEVIGTTFWPLIKEEDREQVRRRIAALSPDAPVSAGRHRASASGGETIWMEWVDRGLFDETGAIVELQSVGRDITERVRFEEQARRVGNADAVARVSAAIAHDLNNLVMVLSSRLDLIEARGGATEETLAMSKTLDGMAELVRKLGKLRFGIVFEPRLVDLNTRVHHLWGLLAEVSGEGVVLEQELSELPCNILGDPTQIDQVLLNLVRNGVEAMPRGGAVRILTRVEDSAILEVVDTGSGIDASLLSRIFDPGVTTKKTGQGLGLATVRTIVEGHGGRVSVRSTPGGTHVEMAFPLASG